MSKMCNKLGSFLGVLTLGLVFSTALNGQYYYKDIVVSRQISDNYRLLKVHKVSKISFSTFVGSQPVEEGIQLEQTVNTSNNTVLTYTHTPDAPESWLTAQYNNNGLLIATVDSNAETVTSTVYNYAADNRITSISTHAVSKDNFTLTEDHAFVYNSTGALQKMMKTKNGHDTVSIQFVLDENGNVAEERMNGAAALPATFYYYDADHRLTDIARFNQRANRILPEYMFEYNAANQVTQMIVVPEGSTDYQTWKYFYNDNALKEKEVCLNKQKELMGKVEYQYQYAK